MPPQPRMNLSGLTKLPIKLIFMEQIKSYFYLAVFGVTTLFPVLSVEAQTNAQGNDRTIESTIVEETPEVVTQERKTLWGLVKSGGFTGWAGLHLKVANYFQRHVPANLFTTGSGNVF